MHKTTSRLDAMIEYLIVSNNALLVRVANNDIAFNLSSFERIIEQQLKNSAKMFIRVGRGLLINSNFIYVININKQELILANTSSSVKYTLHVSKEALRGLKSLIEKTI